MNTQNIALLWIIREKFFWNFQKLIIRETFELSLRSIVLLGKKDPIHLSWLGWACISIFFSRKNIGKFLLTFVYSWK